MRLVERVFLVFLRSVPVLTRLLSACWARGKRKSRPRQWRIQCLANLPSASITQYCTVVVAFTISFITYIIKWKVFAREQLFWAQPTRCEFLNQLQKLAIWIAAVGLLSNMSHPSAIFPTPSLFADNNNQHGGRIISEMWFSDSV